MSTEADALSAGITQYYDDDYKLGTDKMIDWWQITSRNFADCPSNIQHVAGIINTTLTNLKNTNYWDT